MADTHVLRNSSQQELQSEIRKQELKAFDDTKAGVKGLIDAGISKVPEIFLVPTSNDIPYKTSQASIPVIDLKDENLQEDGVGRKDLIDKVRVASETVGFFQVVNHGIPKEVLDEMMEAVRRFHEQPNDLKIEYYTRDRSRKVRLNTNYDLYKSKAANWRDSLLCAMGPVPAKPEEIPPACREISILYSEQVKKVGLILLELLSEALGLKPKYLEEMGSGEGQLMVYHYYPACPEPNKTIGTAEHSDPGFITIVLQDQIGGLQVLYENQWIDVTPTEGALVINVGDLIQLLSNDKFKSAKHRVLANNVGPRISVICFFTTHDEPVDTVCGPIKELLSEDNPPVFKDTTMREYGLHYTSKPLESANTALEDLRLLK